MSGLEDRVSFIENPEQPHVATVLLLDASGSMSGEKIIAVNQGLRKFKEEIEADPLAASRVDLAVLAFGDIVKTAKDFGPVTSWEPSDLAANGGTPMGEAILRAVEMVETRKSAYKQMGIDYYRPWLFLVTDGAPTDMHPGDALWEKVVRAVHDGEKAHRFLFFSVAVDPCDASLLKQIAPPNRPPVRLQGMRFAEMFQWLSRSQKMVSSSRAGDTVPLENPEASGWGQIVS
jgi:uncharacterized protein YegL